MLLKSENKIAFQSNNGKGKLRSAFSSRNHRKILRVPTGKKVVGKKLSFGKHQKFNNNVTFPPATTSLCDNSNDSGLGLDNHESHLALRQNEIPFPSANKNKIVICNGTAQNISSHNLTRPLSLIKPEDSLLQIPKFEAPTSPAKNVSGSSKRTLISNHPFSNISQDKSVELLIITQPESQHRARYQTEGSRGAVKDKSGNGFPVVKLNGYNKPAILEVFIGNDVGIVSPHIFYQACKVSGKNSTPCQETKIDGTMVIEIDLKPENDMTVICDCVGILKERNVDVEHRLGKDNNNIGMPLTRNKKKSTKCRMIFRTRINEDRDYSETLEVCSSAITCTQPPGIPEICKKSLDSCSVLGGRELFIIGKNFSKDTSVSFVKYDAATKSTEPRKMWEKTVQPDKEYLQQTHLICVIPPYTSNDEDADSIKVHIYVTSNNKTSEAHNFYYTRTSQNYTLTPQIPQTNIEKNSISNEPQGEVSSSKNSQVEAILPLTWGDGDQIPGALVLASQINSNMICQKNCNDSFEKETENNFTIDIAPCNVKENGLQDAAEQEIFNCSVLNINNLQSTPYLNENKSLNDFQNAEQNVNVSANTTETFINMMCTEPSTPNSNINAENILNSNEATDEANVSLISNAVSAIKYATAETQAAVKQIIANNHMMADIKNLPAIGNLASSDSQHLQEIPFSELITPASVKKEILNRCDALAEQDNIMNPNNLSSATSIAQSFSPSPDLTSMSESDLISFINPSVFM